ncbi:hypothetical protein LPJ72_005670, partial [Coemansia sp. Benny D160-2]
MAAMDPIIVHRQQHHQQQQQQHSTLSQMRDISQATSTAELTKMIRQVSDALDAEMRAPNANHFAPHTEALRCDCLELFRKLLVRNPYSSQRKDIPSKMWFRTIYPSIEQYRANIRQLETMLHAAAAVSGASSSPSPLSSSSAATAFSTVAAAAAAAVSSGGNPAAKPDTITTRKELSKWRARFQTFLQASAGMLLRMVVELAETHALVAAGSLSCLSDCALDARTLATHVYGFDFVDCLRSELHPTLSSTQRAALAIISKLLTHLGDLSRYRILYTSKKQQQQQHQHQRQTNNNNNSITATGDGASSSNGSYSAGDDVWWAAKNFYRAAIKLAPHRGQPHNQIAVIYGYEKNSLEGVFHYYRALSAQYDFMPSEANLRTILDNALRAVDNLDSKNKHNLSQQQQQQQQQSPNKQQRQRHQEKRQLRSKASAKSVDESDEGNAATGYAYYDKQIYARFTHLRYLFAFNCPTLAAIAALESENPLDQTATDQKTVTPEMEEQISTEIGLACGKFVHGAKSGLIDERQALMTQAVHLIEQQRLAGLNANAAETRLHDPVIARLSAHLSMRIAEHVCFGISRSISDAMGAHKGGNGNGNGSASSAARLAIKSPSDLLSNPSRRTLPLLVQTLIWIVSACIRVVKDSTSRDYLAAHGGAPITELKSQVFKVIRDCGLLANMRKLRTAMEQAHGKISRRSPLTSPVAWKDTLLSMDNLTHHIWTLSNASGGTSAQRGYEPELLAGWQLPDGSVWGRLAPVEETDQNSKLRPLSPLADISEDTRLLALWRQLYWLLSVLLEALPMVLDLVDREESAQQPASDSVDQKQHLGRADEEILLHKATPDGSESNSDDDDDDDEYEGEDAENETICFQGRPQWQQRQPSAAAAAAPPQLHSVASAASSVALEGTVDAATQSDWHSSVPPTPQMAQQTYKSLRQSSASNNNSSVSEKLLLSELWRMAAPQQRKEQGSLKEEAELESTESAMRMIEQMELAKETRAYGSGSGGQSVAAGFSPEMAPYYGRSSGVGAGPIGSRFQGSAIAAATAIPSASSAAGLDGISSITAAGGGGQSYNQNTMAAQKTSGAMSPDDVYRARQHQHQQPHQQQQHSVSAVTSALYSPQLLPVSLIGNGSSSGGKQNAMDAWQQYQMEHQRKVVLQQQLEEQQKLQHQLNQRLAGQGMGAISFLQQQQQQKHIGSAAAAAAALGSGRDGDDYQMDTTTASVVSMALSAPTEKQQKYRAGGDLSSVYSAYGNFSANGRVQSMATATAS